MTILLLTHSYPEEINTWRGSFIREQAKALSQINRVIVVYFKVDNERFTAFPKSNFRKTENGNLSEYVFTTTRTIPVLNQFNYLIRTLRFLNHEIIASHKIDIIHSHLSYPAGFLGVLLQKSKKIPAVVTEHSRISNYHRSWIHKQFVRYTLKNACNIISVSNSLRDEILLIVNRPVSVIHNIIDINKFKLSTSNQEKKVVFGFLGGLGNNNKGLDLLIKSLASLESKEFILNIGGKGELLEGYMRMAKEYGIGNNCQFLGEIPHDKISEFYSKLDLFILASRYETFGMVLIEAMACGIPVISTKCGGPQEIVTEATGILVEKENSKELTAALNIMSDNIGKYNKVSIRNYVETKFGHDLFIKRITALYNETITNNYNG